jgi:hypothetical protein
MAAYLRRFWNPGHVAWYKPLGAQEESFPTLRHLMRLSKYYVIIQPGSGGYGKVDRKSASAVYEMCSGEFSILAKRRNNPYNSRSQPIE